MELRLGKIDEITIDTRPVFSDINFLMADESYIRITGFTFAELVYLKTAIEEAIYPK